MGHKHLYSGIKSISLGHYYTICLLTWCTLSIRCYTEVSVFDYCLFYPYGKMLVNVDWPGCTCFSSTHFHYHICFAVSGADEGSIV